MKHHNFKHGDIKTKLYHKWTAMRARCENENSPAYANYGGKGVAVCEEWQEDFIIFRSWAENNGYKEELDLELDKDILSKKLGINPPIYSPETCMFLSRKEHNKLDKGIRITYGGVEYLSLREAEVETGISRYKLRKMLHD